jgi:transcriptional regulator with XRE-family HTH domain
MKENKKGDKSIPEKDLEDIGKMVKLARRQAGFSLRELSHYCGVAYYKISEIENGKSGTTIFTLSKIMKCLDKSIREGFKDLGMLED